jgi:hypothetical protein
MKSANGSDAAAIPPWGWLEMLVLAQWLSSGLLLVPGAQGFRTLIRALPYVLSIGLLLMHLGRRGFRPSFPRWSRLLLAALFILVVGLFHPQTNLPAGVAQILLQLSIAGPAFWAASEMRSGARLNRLIWLLFIGAAVNAAVGILQVYFPGTFMPPEFSSVALAMNPEAVSSLTYIGADGREIIRPPGLSDYPGGASVAAMMTGLLGIALASQRSLSMTKRVALLLLSAVGIATLFLTQVRSLLLMMVASLALLALLLLRQRRLSEASSIVGFAVAMLAVSFLWATAVGGESVSARFKELFETGPVAAYQQHRGGFVTTTLRELLTEYPLGAGVGRWGMMNVHFGERQGSAPIHVEIQMTGWLLDGGVLMWLVYGGAILLAMRFVYRTAARSANRELAFCAAIVFCICFMVVGQSMAGPSFNTVLGLQFWLLVSGVYGVARQQWVRQRAEARVPAPLSALEGTSASS